MNRYHLIFRACDAVYAVHSRPRPFGLQKQDVITASFSSLLETIARFQHDIVVLGDRLSPETLRYFGTSSADIVNDTLYNEGSIRRSFEIASTFPDDDWVYFCEDDYLHLPHAFRFIDELITNRHSILDTKLDSSGTGQAAGNLSELPLVIHPPDYPDRYKPGQRLPSYLFVSKYCHWRQIANTTFTFLTQAKTVKQFRGLLDQCIEGADDALLSRSIYASKEYSGKALCISPIPGLAAHLHEGVLTPLVEWDRVARPNERWNAWKWWRRRGSNPRP